VQVCTAVMHRGFRIVEDLCDGLSHFLDSKGMKSVAELRGKALGAYVEWGDLDLSYKVSAHVDPAKCIGCELCLVACRDASVDAIHTGPVPLAAGHVAATRDQAIARAAGSGVHVTWVDETACTGCNLCSHLCPVPGCITMKDVTGGKPFESWNDRIAKGTHKAGHHG